MPFCIAVPLLLVVDELAKILKRSEVSAYSIVSHCVPCEVDGTVEDGFVRESASRVQTMLDRKEDYDGNKFSDLQRSGGVL